MPDDTTERDPRPGRVAPEPPAPSADELLFGDGPPSPAARVPLKATAAGVIWALAAAAWVGMILLSLTVPEPPPRPAGAGPPTRQGESAGDFGRACGAGCCVVLAGACAWHGYAIATGRARDTALAGALSILLAVPVLLVGAATVALAPRGAPARPVLVAGGLIQAALSLGGFALPGALALAARRDYLDYRRQAGAGAPPADPPG